MSFDHRPLYDLYHQIHKAINRFESGLAESCEMREVFGAFEPDHSPLKELFNIEGEILSALIELEMEANAKILCLRRFEIILKRQRKIRVFVLGYRGSRHGNTLQTELFEVLNTFQKEIQKAAKDQDFTRIEGAISEFHGFLNQHTPGAADE